jgi:hypothetical protein
MSDETHKQLEAARYVKAAHRLQTAIAFNPDKSDKEPKHLRVGIDLSKSDLAGLAQLLIDKGVFSEDEYLTAIADQAEIEADMHEQELSQKLGANVTTL